VPRDIGIDLGQTNTRAAWLSGAEDPQILSNSDNERLTPTLVAVHAGGQLLAGRGALGIAATSPERAARDLVARLDSGCPVTLEGKSYSPESLVAFFLRKLKSDAEARLNDTVSRAFVAVPPTWNAAARKRLCDAGAEAGLTILPMESSLAAALAAGFRQPSDRPRYVLVYDLGGTNFSVAVLTLEGASLRIRKTATLAGVGGAAFDQLLVDYVVALIEEQHHVDARLHGRFMTELYKQAEQAKILLGAHRSADVHIAGMLRSADGSPLDVDVEIEREEFERMLEDQVRSTLLATLNVLGEAGVLVEELEAVILIGGSTSIPAVRSAVQELVGVKKVAQNVDPVEGIALGAAWMTGSLGVQPQPADPAAVVVVAAVPQAVSQPAPQPEPVPAPQVSPPAPEPAQQPEAKPEPPAPPPPAPEPAAPVAPAPQPPAPQYARLPSPRLWFPHAWFWPLLFLSLFGESATIVLNTTVPSSQQHAVSGGLWVMFFIIPLLVLLPIFTYRLWSRIQDGHTNISPARAVGFMFIPFLNWGWIALVWGGYATALNRFRARHGLPGRASRGVTYTFVAANWVLWVSTLTPVTSLGMLFFCVALLVFVAHTGRLTSDLLPVRRERRPPRSDAALVRCHYCAEFIPPDSPFCTFCGRSQAVTAAGYGAHEPRKKCPRCAEWIKAEALVCRFCGHSFESGS
jgi:actin-like ATPase involved in cell morphogenesis